MRARQIVKVAFLLFVVVARHLGVERDVLRHPVESEPLQYVEPFRLVLGEWLLEGFPRLIHRRVAVVERTAPLVFVLIDRGLALGVQV